MNKIELKNIKKFKFCYANKFAQNPLNKKLESTFYGEVFEASFYEYLINKVEKDNSNFKVLEKGPYIKDKFKIKEGFSCDETKSCYFSSKLTRAEFDAIKYDDNNLYFYECTTKNSNNKNSILKNINFKKFLLSKLFPNKKIFSILVSNNNELLKYFERNNHVDEAIYYNLPNCNLLDIARNYDRNTIDIPNCISSFRDFNKEITSRFEFLDEFKKVSESFYTNDDLEKLYEDVKKSKGVVQRIYWGKIAFEDFIKYKKGKWKNKNKIQIKDVILCINYSSINNFKLRFYYKKGNDFYDIENFKKLGDLKASKKELSTIQSLIPSKKFEEIIKVEKSLKFKY